jgi:hypothetical protein
VLFRAVPRVRARAASLARRLVSAPWMRLKWAPSWQAARILWQGYGHLASVRSGRAKDAAGGPLPWYTYPAMLHSEIARIASMDWNAFQQFVSTHDMRRCTL